MHMQGSKVERTVVAGRPGWHWGLAILLVALIVRLWGLGFGLPAINDPDELMFELGAIRMLRTHTLDPGWFGHPATITMYMLALADIAVFLVGHVLGWFATVGQFTTAIYANPAWVILPGRLIMVGFGTWSVALTAKLGSRLFDRRTGLAAAALLAIDPVHIAWSQIIRSDIVGSAFLLLTMLAALNVARHGRGTRRAALWCALSIASKWPFALGGLTVAGANWLRWHRGEESARRGLGLLAAFAALTPLFLIVVAPYLLIDCVTVFHNMQGEVQLHHLGATGGSPLFNAWWYLSGPLASGLGVVGLVLAGIGLVLAWHRDEVRMILFSVILSFFVLFCFQNLVWERWGLPLLPLLSVLTGAALVATIRRIGTSRVTGQLIAGVLITAVVVPLLLAAASNASARQNDTRQRAARWAIAHIPAGRTVIVEHFAFDLLPRPWHFLFPVGETGCVDARAMLTGKVSNSTIAALRGERSNVDYGTMAASKRPTCRADYAIITQYDRYAAEKSDFPAEYAAYQALLAQGHIVASFYPDKPLIGGPVTRIVAFNQR